MRVGHRGVAGRRGAGASATPRRYGGLALFGGLAGGFGGLGRSLRVRDPLPGLLRESLRRGTLLGGAHDAPHR